MYYNITGEYGYTGTGGGPTAGTDDVDLDSKTSGNATIDYEPR